MKKYVIKEVKGEIKLILKNGNARDIEISTYKKLNSRGKYIIEFWDPNKDYYAFQPSDYEISFMSNSEKKKYDKFQKRIEISPEEYEEKFKEISYIVLKESYYIPEEYNLPEYEGYKVYECDINTLPRELVRSYRVKL